MAVEPLVDVLWSCIVTLKDVQSSPWYEGFTEALKALGEVMNEIRVGIPTCNEISVSDRFQAVEAAIAQLSMTDNGVSIHPPPNGPNETHTATDDE